MVFLTNWFKQQEQEKDSFLDGTVREVQVCSNDSYFDFDFDTTLMYLSKISNL